MTDDDYADFIERINEGFLTLDDAIINSLPGRDTRYAEMKAHEQELKERFPNINAWLEDTTPLTLTAEEHAGLVEYLELEAGLECIERLAIYYTGHKDCFAYLRKIGAI